MYQAFQRHISDQDSILSLSPADFADREQRIAADEFVKKYSDQFCTWEVRNNHPELIAVNEKGIRDYLALNGHSQNEIERYIKVLVDPSFNEKNRRGFDRLVKRVASCEKIAASLWGDEKQRHLEHIPIRVAYIPYLNAGAFPVPGGGDAIILNVGLAFMFDYFIFSNQINKVILQDPSLVKPVSTLARAVFGSRSDTDAFITAYPRSIEVDSKSKLEARVQMAMSTLFIVLHEYGHIALGHTKELREWKQDEELSYSELLSRRSLERKWEYDADKFAFDVLSGVYAAPDTASPGPGWRNTTTTWLFSMMQMGTEPFTLDYALRSHPTPKERMCRLLGLENDFRPSDFFAAVTETDEKATNRFTEEMLVPLLRETEAIADK